MTRRWVDSRTRPIERAPATLRAMSSPQTAEALRTFVAARNWSKFHTPENLAKSITIEASELLELYQWTDSPNQREVEDELADVVTCCIHLANQLGVDLDEIVLRKLQQTEQKYPVELNQGTINKREIE